MARKLSFTSSKSTTSSTSSPQLIKSLILLSKDIASVSAKALDLQKDRDTFQTDTAISGTSGPARERKLQKWGDDIEGESLEELEGQPMTQGQWDQFAVNERLFGVRTDFNEEIYTTTLDKNTPDYKQREVMALKLAREIERTPANTYHGAEERGQIPMSSMEDEENLYSAVIRPSNKYVPPAARSKTTSTLTQSTEKQADKSTLPHSEKQSDKKSVKPHGQFEKFIDKKSPPKNIQASGRPLLNIPGNREAPSSSGRDNIFDAKLAAKLTAKDFKYFANAEKEQLMQRKESLMKKEREDIFTEFKTFSKSFKYNKPVPADLVPILTTEKSQNTTEVLDTRELVTNADLKIELSPPVAKEPSEQDGDDTKSVASTNTSFKFNVSALEFKPNPNAVEFVTAKT
ncbi:hypothetical protein HK096_002623 [Nowakowskiella sp. JEL0078]|nr:hypothetical protein HK096_002623 [Nowakowskiella sp. JEL0078]